jgi:hypothetical protein
MLCAPRSGRSSKRQSQPYERAYPWLRAVLLYPWVRYLVETGRPLTTILKKSDLIGLMSGKFYQQPIGMYSAICLMHDLVKSEGSTLPQHIVSNRACFNPVRMLFLPGARTVGDALLGFAASIDTHISHVRISIRRDRDGHGHIRGWIKSKFEPEEAHVLQLYLISVIQHLCEDAGPPTKSGGSDHLNEQPISKVMERTDRPQFVVTVLKPVLESYYSPMWALQRQPICSAAPEGFEETVIAVAGGMDGVATADRLAKAANVNVCNLQRWARKHRTTMEELLATSRRRKGAETQPALEKLLQEERALRALVAAAGEICDGSPDLLDLLRACRKLWLRSIIDLKVILTFIEALISDKMEKLFPKSVYTPRYFIDDFLLDRPPDCERSALASCGYDPSCGSGAFLLNSTLRITPKSWVHLPCD